MDKRYALTFDIDWAPDFAILHCLELLDDARCKATFFATHSTPLNQEIVNRGHNLGIHPNFLPNSSQGSSVQEIISECLSYAPDAWCMRTHALVQSSPLLHEISCCPIKTFRSVWFTSTKINNHASNLVNGFPFGANQ